MNYIPFVNVLTFCILFVVGGILTKSLYEDTGYPACSQGWFQDEQTNKCYTAVPDTDLTTQEKINYCWTQLQAYYSHGACIKDVNTASSCEDGWTELDYGQCVLYNLMQLRDTTFSALCTRLQGNFEKIEGVAVCVKTMSPSPTDDRHLVDTNSSPWKRAFGNSGFGRK